MGRCSICPGDRKFRNVILLSVSFMLIFTAFRTLVNIEETVLASIRKDDPSFNGDAYISSAIIYSVFAICNWLAPPFISWIGPKWTMLVGSFVYTAFISSFFWPNATLLYCMSAVQGFAAAILWTGQGSYLILSSSPETMARNTGVFWAVSQSSLLFGNIYVYSQVHGSVEIDKQTRQHVFLLLAVISVVGIVCLLFLRAEPRPRPDDTESETSVDQVRDSPLDALKKSFRLFFKNKKMMLLSVTFVYTGIMLSFYSGVYSTAIANTATITEAKRLIGLVGVLVGVGEILGGAGFGILASKTAQYGRDPVVMIGFLSHIVAFYLIFINLPNESPFEFTTSMTYIDPPWVGLLLLAAFLIGFGDSCFVTQIYSILGQLFPESSAPAVALFKFTQSAATAASFFYSTECTLMIQLSILVVFSILGTLTFFAVEWGEAASPQEAIVNEVVSEDNEEQAQFLDDEDDLSYVEENVNFVY